MRSTDHFVSLREELESIDQYLDIEVVRFGPQLRVVKDVSPDTLDVIVPGMLLQPIIENSIKHGLSRKVGGGRITIRTSRKGDRSFIEVEDDGLGMTEERLKDALESTGETDALVVIGGAVMSVPIVAACFEHNSDFVPARIDPHPHPSDLALEARFTVWLRDLSDRKALNEEWQKMFPDPAARPAWHALLHQGDPVNLIMCDFTAVID